MAAQDYYDSFHPSRREDAPLPPVPSSSPPKPHVETHGSHHVSPVHSPFDDGTYPAYPQQSVSTFSVDSAYHGAEPHKTNSHDPFGDQNAIPLQTQKTYMDSHTQPAGMGYGDPEDPYGDHGGHHRERRRRRRRRSHRREPEKKGWFSGRVTWMVYILTTVQVVVFIAQLVRNAALTKSPIEIKPNFNPMIGPSPYVLINMGARYVPCMRNTDPIQNQPAGSPELKFPCPNSTTNDPQCTLSQLCGFNGVPNPHPGGSLDDKPEPNQWFRFIIPMFLHAGIIHIGFNMLLQVTLGRDIEKSIGSIRFALVYFSSGIFGFVLGGNYAAPGIASCGASGALFALIALHLLDLLYTWEERTKPVRELLFIILDIVIAFILGLLPGLDNFSHIGGFLMGIALGVCILHSPNKLRERIGVDEPPYSAMHGGHGGSGQPGGVVGFIKQPVGFFKGRKPLWWAWWLVRAGALLAVLIGFILLLNNFYTYRKTCGWCKYLSCLPVSNWCDIGNIHVTQTNTSRVRRDMSGFMGIPEEVGVYMPIF